MRRRMRGVMMGGVLMRRGCEGEGVWDGRSNGGRRGALCIPSIRYLAAALL